MKGAPAVYLGKIVDKNHFRVFVYAVDGSQKLVESWDDFEHCMESGLWFATKEDASSRVPVEKPKRSSPKKPVEEKAEAEEVKSMNLEDHVVKDDDFLPKASK